MFESIVKGIVEGAKSTKTYMASFLMASLIQKYANIGNNADKNTLEFGLNFFAIFCGSFLIISFFLWLFNNFKENVIVSNRIAQKAQLALDSLEILTNEEMQLITDLVNRGRISGVLEISGQDSQILDRLSNLRIIEKSFIDDIGAYRAAPQYRYRYQINEAVFNGLTNKEK